MNNINALIQKIQSELHDEINIIKKEKPNIAIFWDKYLDEYINNFHSLIDRLYKVKSNDIDLTMEQIMILYSLN